ncbi:MAG: alpha/beta hydrolase [Saprospiraceae bacterium]|nr:alpha/beta hydrolase [Saprospiraceae bacterium]
MPEGGEILLYAHSMLGDAPGYSDYAEWIVRKHFQEDKLLMIVEWGGWNPLYHAQLQLARDKAPVLARILDAIEPVYAINILSHSMGSDLIRIALLESSTVAVHTWILLAPDIARHDFTRDLPVLQHHVKRMAIFTARHDPFLTLAKILRKEPVLRLGDRSQLEVSFYETEHFGCKLIKHGAWLVCQDLRDAIKKIVNKP